MILSLMMPCIRLMKQKPASAYVSRAAAVSRTLAELPVPFKLSRTAKYTRR